MNKICKKSGPLRVRLSTEKNKKKLLTVRVGLFSLREKAPTKNRYHVVVSANAAEQPTAAKQYTEQDGRPDMYPKAYHSYSGEAIPQQSEHVVAKNCAAHKTDERNRHINNDDLQVNTAAVP